MGAQAPIDQTQKFSVCPLYLPYLGFTLLFASVQLVTAQLSTFASARCNSHVGPSWPSFPFGGFVHEDVSKSLVGASEVKKKSLSKKIHRRDRRRSIHHRHRRRSIVVIDEDPSSSSTKIHRRHRRRRSIVVIEEDPSWSSKKIRRRRRRISIVIVDQDPSFFFPLVFPDHEPRAPRARKFPVQNMSVQNFSTINFSPKHFRPKFFRLIFSARPSVRNFCRPTIFRRIFFCSPKFACPIF